MRRTGNGAVAAGLAAALATAAPAGERLTAAYELHLGGVKLADLSLSARLTQAGYEARAELETSGFVKRFVRAGFRAEAEGRRAGAELVPVSFSADAFDSAKRQTVEIRFGAGRPQAVRAEPPFKPKPWEIDPSRQSGAVDPLTAALALFRPQPRESLCARSVEAFDGRKRTRLSLRDPEPEGAAIRCEGVYERVAGFKPKQMEEPEFPLTVWFARDGDGAWRLARASAPTRLGIATLRRAR